MDDALGTLTVTPKGRVRSLTIAEDRGARKGPANYPLNVIRPKTRGDCEGGVRPCPFVSCRYNLYLDVNPHTGALKLNFPHLEPDQISESCSLDIADLEGRTLDEVGEVMNLTRERVRQIQDGLTAKLQRGLRRLQETD